MSSFLTIDQYFRKKSFLLSLSRLSLLFLFLNIFSYSLGLTGCSSPEVIKKGGNLDLIVQPAMINVWVNLMPGTNKPKLHVLGETNVKNQSKEPIRNLIIKNITIYQNNESLFDFVPSFEQQNVTGSIDFLPGELRLYAFGSKSGLDVVSDLNFDEPITLVVEFSSLGDTYYAKIKGVQIKRVY